MVRQAEDKKSLSKRKKSARRKGLTGPKHYKNPTRQTIKPRLEKTRGEFYQGTESAEGELELELSLYKSLGHRRGHCSVEDTTVLGNSIPRTSLACSVLQVHQ